MSTTNVSRQQRAYDLIVQVEELVNGSFGGEEHVLPVLSELFLLHPRYAVKYVLRYAGLVAFKEFADLLTGEDQDRAYELFWESYPDSDIPLD